MNILFWIYLCNAIVLIIHEIDSAYWKEWKLLNPEKEEGINGFLIAHIPMLFLILIGLVLINDQIFAGLIISLVVCAGGFFAFVFHFYHLRKGRLEFNTPISKSLIIAMPVISVFQLIFTIKQMI